MFLKNLDAASVGARLGLSEDFNPWLEELASIEPSFPFRLPDMHEVDDLFARLGVSPADAVEIVDAWPNPEQSPEIWWLLQRCYQQIVAQTDNPYRSLRWQTLPPHLGAVGRLFYIYVFLSALPIVRQRHREYGIPDDIAWTTLADLGEHIAIHRRVFGNAGLSSPRWLVLHFRGDLYRLGRLQFERARLSAWQPIYDDILNKDVSGPRPILDTPILSVHIPESGGPLEPAACSASLAQARDFFARHFPEEPYRFGGCASWLLDPQLADYLPPTSNIVRFQRMFHIVSHSNDGDQDVMQFVFRRTTYSLDELPQRTTLERAVVEHLRSGRHWQFRYGWLAL
ncbi:MAG TPA: acyltransferase domain-containing protein [Ktedonobacteraceae bacterium]